MLKQKKQQIETSNKQSLYKMQRRMIKFGEKNIEIPFSIFLKFWLAFVIIVYISYLLFQSLEVIYLLITAFIISIAMETVINWFQRIKFIGRGGAVILSYLLLFTLIIAVFVLIVPFVLSQSAEIIKVIVDKIIVLQKQLQNNWLTYVVNNIWWLPSYVKKLIINALNDSQFMIWLQEVLQKNISEIAKFGTDYVKNIWQIVVTVVWKFLSAIVQVIFVLVFAIFFSIEKEKVVNFISKISWNERYMKIKLKFLYERLWNWLKGQLLLCFFIWIAVYIGLWVLVLFWIDLPNKLTLALMAWIAEFIPIVWPALGASPMALVALTQYWFIGLLVIVIFYTILQLSESHILVPLVMNQALWVSALLILVTMTLGGVIFGFIWILLWVPLAVILGIFFEDFFKD